MDYIYIYMRTCVIKAHKHRMMAVPDSHLFHRSMAYDVWSLSGIAVASFMFSLACTSTKKLLQLQSML